MMRVFVLFQGAFGMWAFGTAFYNMIGLQEPLWKFALAAAMFSFFAAVFVWAIRSWRALG